MKDVPTPLNSEERYFYAIALRLDALCNMMSSFIEVYAKQNGIATTTHTETEQKVEKPKKTTTTKKRSTTKKVKSDES